MTNHELSFTPQEALSSTPKTPEKIGGNFAGKDILSMEQFDPISISKLFKVVPKMKEIAWGREESHILEGDIVIHVFYEPSSRTRTSFQAAVAQLGGRPIIVENPQNYSSEAKGETFEDTIRTYEAYCDAIVIRHKEVGMAQKAAEVATTVPIINAGDGKGEHPTQALLDLYTIQEKFERLDNLKGVITGDIKNGRTVHSLLEGLSLYPNNEVFLLSPEELKLDSSMIERHKNRGLKIVEIEDPSQIPSDANYWYWTRVQKERIDNPEQAQKLAHDTRFTLDLNLLQEKGNPNMIVMHPLPRVNEITLEVDKDPRAVYLKTQIRNGMYVRMALMALVLGRIRSY